MDDTALSCGKCGAVFKHKKGVAKHVLREQCGRVRGRGGGCKKRRRSSRCAINGVQNEAIPVSRVAVSQIHTPLIAVG
jgi:uncharacterized C2H2 Zn-finger protein